MFRGARTLQINQIQRGEMLRKSVFHSASTELRNLCISGFHKPSVPTGLTN